MPVTLFTQKTAVLNALKSAEVRRETALQRKLKRVASQKEDYSALSLTRVKAQLDCVNAKMLDQLTRRVRHFDSQTADRLAVMQARLIDQLHALLNPPKSLNGHSRASNGSPDDISPADQ